MVFFAVDDAPGLVAALERAGVRMGATGPRRVRAVTHLDVDADAVRRAGELVVRALQAALAA
jgi:threonine aldolase